MIKKRDYLYKDLFTANKQKKINDQLNGTDIFPIKTSKTFKDELVDLKRERDIQKKNLKEKEKKIDVWYEEGIERLKQKHDIDSPDSAYAVINLKVWPTYPNQFVVEGGTNACMCISFVSVNTLLTPGKSPLNIHWNAIIDNGIQLHKCWRRINQDEKTHPSIEDISSIYPDNKRELSIIKILNGTLDEKKLKTFNLSNDTNNMEEDKIYTLKESMSIFQKKEKSAAILSLFCYNISLFYDKNVNEMEMWIFDSHGGTQEHKSSLICFETDLDLIHYIKKYKYNSTPTGHENEFKLILLTRNKD